MNQIIKILIFFFLINYQSTLFSKDQQVFASDDLLQAVEQLNQANESNKKSRKLILKANAIRQQLKKIRTKKTLNQNETKNKITQLVKQLEDSQQQGAQLRSHSTKLTKTAAIKFEKGFVKLWPNWLKNREPLTMDNTVKNFFAHNTQVRSVHQNMLSKVGTPEESITSKRKDMSLQIPALVEQNAPPDLNINAFRFSRKQQYFSHIEVHSVDQLNKAQESSRNVSAVPLNKIHQWRLFVSDLKGKPLQNAAITIEGHMPGHVHGLPTAPEITKEIAPGVYLVDGMKFQMKGWWVIKFILPPLERDTSTVSSPDFFTFNLVL